MNDIKKMNQSFSIEDLLKGKISKDNFQIDYLPMWKMLDNLDRKTQGGLNSLKTEEVWKKIYDFAVISISMDKADMQTRIDNLNEQNLKWFTKADTLEAENTRLKQRVLELERQVLGEAKSTETQAQESQPFSENF